MSVTDAQRRHWQSSSSCITDHQAVLVPRQPSGSVLLCSVVVDDADGITGGIIILYRTLCRETSVNADCADIGVLATAYFWTLRITA